MKTENAAISIQSVQFLLRHPWLFICPFVIIFSIVYASTSLIVNEYECSATLSVGSAGGAIIEKIAQKQDDFVSKILMGSSIGAIIKAGWPNISEQENPTEYESLVGLIKSPKTGISVKRDKKDSNVVIVSFIHKNAKVCYRVVKAAVDTMLTENKRASEEKIEAGVAFLRKQIDFYRDKIKKIDEEISALKVKLQGMAGSMNEEERALIREITTDDDTVSGSGELQVQKSVKYEEILAELNLQLLDAEKRRDLLKRKLENKDFLPEVTTPQNVNDDQLMREYVAKIAANNLMMSELMAKGYTSEHPDVKRLSLSIKDLKELQNRRTRELTGFAPTEMSESDKKITEDRMNAEISNLEMGIETLKEKIRMMERRQWSSEEKLKSPGSRFSSISEDASKIAELRNEKEITLTYYKDTRKQLEDALIKSRIEESNAGFVIRVIDEPKEPTKPLPYKKMSIILMGFMMSLGAGGALSYIADTLDKSIKSSAELRELCKIPVLASIERMDTLQEVRANNARRAMTVAGLLAFFILSRVATSILSAFMRSR